LRHRMNTFLAYLVLAAGPLLLLALLISLWFLG
jgi:hypothetical protein